MKSRDKEILNLLVENYINTKEPVASKTILENGNLSCSSATIRNVMKGLEEEEFLYQPHTSAGRIPSDKGYRVYVNELLENMFADDFLLDYECINYLDFDNNLNLVDRAANLLHKETGYFVISVEAPKVNISIQEVKLMRLTNHKLLLIVTMSDGNYKETVLNLAGNFTRESLELLAKFIENYFQNREIHNCSFHEVRKILFHIFEKYMTADFLNSLAYAFYSLIKSYEREPWHFWGEHSLYSYSELGDVDQIATLIDFLKSNCPFLPMASKLYNSELGDTGGFFISAESMPWNESEYPLIVRIGRELNDDKLRACSLISSYCGELNEHYAYLTLVGPKNMDYKRVFRTMDNLRKCINEVVKRRNNNYAIEI